MKSCSGRGAVLLFPVLGLMIWPWFCACSMRPPPFGETREIRLAYEPPEDRPGVSRVCVAGDFNQWSGSRHCMKPDGDRWALTISLPPGRYRYQLLIDDTRRVPDPAAVTSEPDGFGSMNSILIVE